MLTGSLNEGDAMMRVLMLYHITALNAVERRMLLGHSWERHGMMMAANGRCLKCTRGPTDFTDISKPAGFDSGNTSYDRGLSLQNK